MVFLALPFLADGGQGSSLLATHVVAANVFRSGLVMVVREAEVPAGEHSFHLQTIPQALDNTFWYDSPDGAEISDLRTSLQLEPVTVPVDAKTIAQYLRANVGKHVDLAYWDGVSKERVKVSGIETSFGSDDGYPDEISIRQADATVRSIGAHAIDSLSIKGLTGKTAQRGTKAALRVDLRTRCDKPSHIRFTSMEIGAAWAASYKVDLSGAQAAVTAKAQLALGGVELNDSTTQLVTGMPDLGTGTRLDLATGSTSLTEWLNVNQNNNYGYNYNNQVSMAPPDPDPYVRIAALIARGQQNGYVYDPQTGFFFRQNGGSYGYGGFGAGGGMGGGRGFGGAAFASSIGAEAGSVTMMANDAAAQNRLAFIKQAINAERLEDLFSFPMGQISLKPGERLTRVLSRTESHVESHYLWQVDLLPNNSTPKTIRRVLTITNDSKAPWPGGTALVTRTDVPLAEIPMPFTAPGKTADLELGTAEDLPKTQNVKELSRQPTTRANGVPGQLVTYEIDLSVENTRAESLPIDIELDVLGQITESPQAIASRTAAVESLDNPSMRAVWHWKLEPSERMEMKAVYKVVI